MLGHQGNQITMDARILALSTTTPVDQDCQMPAVLVGCVMWHVCLVTCTYLFTNICFLLHAVIKDFCKQIGVDNKQVQGVIRLAKKNGEKLGFLS